MNEPAKKEKKKERRKERKKKERMKERKIRWRKRQGSVTFQIVSMSRSLFFVIGLFKDAFGCPSYTASYLWITIKYRMGKDKQRSDSDIN